MRLVFFFKIFNLSNMIDRIKMDVLEKKIYVALFELITLTARVILLAHFYACLWYVIGVYSANDPNDGASWLDKSDLLNQTVSKKYLESYYFSVITLTTTGYGDISPVSSLEKMIVIIFSLISCIVIGYNLNAIGNLIQQLGENDKVYMEQLKKVNRYLRSHQISLDLREKAR
jgi:Ion channel